MDEREQQRKIRHRLAIIRHAEEVTGNVAMTCRYYGISRPCFYKWLHRYEELGEEGLRDGSSKPLSSPKATKTEVVGKIVYLRENYHFGPQKISMYLKRYHDITISPSGVWRILNRLGISRLPSSQRYKRHKDRWKRYEKKLPGHRVQVDVKFIEPLPGTKKKYYQYTAIDDCTRIRVLRIYPRNNQKSAIQFLDYLLEKLPFQVEIVQTDNGSEFQGSFHWHLLDRGIGHVYIKPATPRLNGKVERSHRIDNEEFYRMLDGVVVDDSGLFNEKLQEWENFYNFDRPHGGLGGQTP
jgi:transposase InsO family protein